MLIELDTISLAVVRGCRLLVVANLSLESCETTVGSEVGRLCLRHGLILGERHSLRHDC